MKETLTMSRAGKVSQSLFVLLLTLFIVIGSRQKIYAQKDSLVRFDKDYVFSYWQDTKKIFAEPFQWKAKQWTTFAGLAGVTAVVYVYDKEVFDFFHDNRTETSENISKYFLEPWGRGLYSIPLLGIIYLTGKNNNHHRNVALTGIKAFVISGAFSVVAKQLFRRHRPYEHEPPNPYLWEGPFNFETHYNSFPSGHTTTAFAVASVLASGYKNKKWIGITSYSLATLVGLSRIHDGNHWPTDVIGGAVLGTFIGTTLSKINFRNIEVFPAAFHKGYGVNIVLRLN